jgi:hypothetical protein
VIAQANAIDGAWFFPKPKIEKSESLKETHAYEMRAYEMHTL